MCGRPHTGGPVPVRDDRPTIVDRVQSLLVTGESRAPSPQSRAYWPIPNRDLDPKGGPFDTIAPRRFERKRVGWVRSIEIDAPEMRTLIELDHMRRRVIEPAGTGLFFFFYFFSLSGRRPLVWLGPAATTAGNSKEALFATVSEKASKGFLLLFSSFVCIVSLVA